MIAIERKFKQVGEKDERNDKRKDGDELPDLVWPFMTDERTEERCEVDLIEQRVAAIQESDDPDDDAELANLAYRLDQIERETHDDERIEKRIKVIQTRDDPKDDAELANLLWQQDEKRNQRRLETVRRNERLSRAFTARDIVHLRFRSRSPRSRSPRSHNDS